MDDEQPRQTAWIADAHERVEPPTSTEGQEVE
jgi:hypothetical protein